MLIKVIFKEGEEGLFNADCQIAFLLDAIKQKHGIARKEDIDLCTLEGEVKHLHLHGYDNGAAYFKTRETCLAVLVTTNAEGHPFYKPALTDYANEQFISLLNHKSDNAASQRLRGRLREQSAHTRTHTPVQAHASTYKAKPGNKTGQKKQGRRLSITRVA